MFKTVPGCRASIESGLFVQLGRFRHDVFVKRLKWDLPMVMAADECEWDEFDRADTVYVVLRTREGEVQGCARLLPTTGPYLMRKLVPDAEADLCDPHVWELSRVAVTQGDAAVPADRKDRMKALLAAVIDAARGRGIRRLIGIAAPAMMRLYRKKGFEGPEIYAASTSSMVEGGVSRLITPCRTVLPPARSASRLPPDARYRPRGSS